MLRPGSRKRAMMQAPKARPQLNSLEREGSKEREPELLSRGGEGV